MGDLGESFRAVRDYNREQNAKRRDANTKYLMKVHSFTRRELTPYQYRFGHGDVGEFIDIYPTRSKYHNIITGERGHYKTVQRFLELQLGRTSQFIANRQEGATNG